MALDTTVGGASSDSYATLGEYQAYAAAMGWTLTASESEQETHMRRARVYLDRAYLWHGYRASETQALQWPRDMVPAVDGFSVASDSIPQPIMDAQCEMAWLIHEGADPFATVSGGEVKRKREKVDVIEEETEYGDARERPLYPSVDALVRGYNKGKQGAVAGSVTLVRA